MADPMSTIHAGFGREAEAAKESAGRLIEQEGLMDNEPRMMDNEEEDDQKMVQEMFADCGYDSSELDLAMQAESDVMGTIHHHHQQQHACSPQQAGASSVNPQARTKALQGLREALALISAEQRKAYDEVQQTNPRLIALESPHERFLVACQYNYWQAAEKLCSYWNNRKDIFGPDRYGLPLLLDPPHETASALSPGAIAYLKQGVESISPHPDRYGRVVMVVDRERVGHCFEEKGRIEASFYFLHAVSESHLGLMNGLVGVVSCERLHLQKNLAKPLPKRSFELFRSEAIPVKCRAGHLVAVEAKPESLPGKLFHQSLSFLTSYFNKFDHLKTRLRFHRVESVDDAVCSLGDYGLSRQHLPKRCGGSADLPSLYQERLEREKEFYASLQNDDLSSQVPDGATKSKEKAHSSTDKKEESTNDIFSEPIANNASAGALSKQQHEELLELSQEFALKRQLAELKREREIALPQQRLMEAKVNVCSAMKDQYDSDLRLLHVYLSFVFISLVPPNSDFVDYFLKHGFVFMGRNLFTGRFMFREALVVWPAFFVPTFMSIRQELPYLTPTQLRKLVASASRIAKRVIQKAESTQNATLSPADRDMRDRLQTILTEHAVSIQQVMSTMPETSLPASTIDSKDEEEEDRELQSELSALQDQVASLQERNGVLKEDRDILEPCTVYATEISQTYDLDKKQHLDILAQEITSMARTSFNSRYSNDTWRYDHQSLEDFLPECYRPKVVAERLFHRLYWSDSVTGIGQPTAPNPAIFGSTPARICPSQVDRVLLAHLLVMDGFMLPADLFHVLPFSDAARLVGMPPPAATHGAHSPPDDTTTTIAPAPEEPTGKKKRPSPPEATAQERQQMVHKRRKPHLKRL